MLREGYGADNQIPCTYRHMKIPIYSLHMQERKECVSKVKVTHNRPSRCPKGFRVG